MRPLLKPALLGAALVAASAPLVLPALGPAAEARGRPDIRPALTAYFEETFSLSLADVRWGDLHVHTQYSGDASLNPAEVTRPEDAYAYARTTKGFTFTSVADHAEAPVTDNLAEGDDEIWQSTLRMTQAASDPTFGDEDGGFIAFPGYEYTNPMPGETPGTLTAGHGHKNVLFRDVEDAPPRRFASVRMNLYSAEEIPDDTLAPTAWDLWEKLEPWRPSCAGCPARAVTMMHTPANIHRSDWDAMDGDFVRNVEIFSQWGNSEGPVPPEAGCPAERLAVDTVMGNLNAPELTVRTQLYRRWVQQGDERYALGFLGGSDDHTGLAASPPYMAGVAGIVSRERSRDALWGNLWSRHTLAAVSSDVLMPVLVAGETAGAQLQSGDLGPHDGSLRLRVLADARAQEIQVLLDGCTVHTARGDALDLTLPLSPGNHFVYVRVLRRDPAPTDAPPLDLKRPVIQQTWTSPIYLAG